MSDSIRLTRRNVLVAALATAAGGVLTRQASAATTLLNLDATIASLRGRVHRYRGVPLVVTYHPAYLLRTLPDKAKAWEDLCLARATMRALPPEEGLQSAAMVSN